MANGNIKKPVNPHTFDRRNEITITDMRRGVSDATVTCLYCHQIVTAQHLDAECPKPR